MDNWLPGFCPLARFVVGVLSDYDKSLKCSKFVDNWGMWDVQKLIPYLPRFILDHLVTMVPPKPENGSDLLV